MNQIQHRLVVDEPGEHDPCYVVMPGGSMISLNHHATEGVDIARAKFIIDACNEKLNRLRGYSEEVCAAALRVARIFDQGCDRCDGDDLTLLEKAGLMEVGVCHDTFGQDSLEVGDAMWTFNAEGNALAKALLSAKPL